MQGFDILPPRFHVLAVVTVQKALSQHGGVRTGAGKKQLVWDFKRGPDGGFADLNFIASKSS